MPEKDNDFKCSTCKKLMFKGVLRDATVEIKCKCGAINRIVITPKQENNTISGVILGESKMSGMVLGTFPIERTE